MAVRIRVYPNGGYGGAGVGAYGAYGPLAQVQLQNEKKTGNLRLEYERALWAEKIKTAQLATAMQYQSQVPYGAAGYGALGGLAGLGGFGGMLGGAIPGGFGMLGAVPGLMGGAGQTNITTQNGTGGNQTVSNSNHHSTVVRHTVPPIPAYGGWGGGYGWGGGGGFLSSLLGALI